MEIAKSGPWSGITGSTRRAPAETVITLSLMLRGSVSFTLYNCRQGVIGHVTGDKNGSQTEIALVNAPY